MILPDPNPNNLHSKIVSNMEFMHRHIEREIRSNFDNALLDSEAGSWIFIAKFMGFKELAESMEVDLQMELNN